MIKDTSLASTVALAEVLFRAREQMGRLADPTPFTVAAIIYVVFTIPLIRLASRLERRQQQRPSGPKSTTATLLPADAAAMMPKGAGPV
jgi:ABC-type amino acid transport system permease subunit